jgi:hypothetical protein
LPAAVRRYRFSANRVLQALESPDFKFKLIVNSAQENPNNMENAAELGLEVKLGQFMSPCKDSSQKRHLFRMGSMAELFRAGT